MGAPGAIGPVSKVMSSHLRARWYLRLRQRPWRLDNDIFIQIDNLLLHKQWNTIAVRHELTVIDALDSQVIVLAEGTHEICRGSYSAHIKSTIVAYAARRLKSGSLTWASDGRCIFIFK